MGPGQGTELVVYGSAIEFDDVGLAYGDGPRRTSAIGGRTRGVTRSTEEKFRVLLHGVVESDLPTSSSVPVSVEVIRADETLALDGDEDDGDGANEAYDDEESQLMAEMARMGLPLGFGKGLGYDGDIRTEEGADEAFNLPGGSSRSHVRFLDGMDDAEEGADGGKVPQRRTVRVKKRHPKKYWLQRYSLFTLYDRGIQIDDEGWYSVTPEVVAWHHASTVVKAHGRGCVVYDAFGGVGGNAIQLALAGCHVIVTEICPDKAYMIRNNARVYGVQERVEVLIGDSMQVAQRFRSGMVDAVFFSPPWGGPEYSNDCMFDVQRMGGYPELGVGKLLHMAVGVLQASSVVLWLPRTSNLQQLGIEMAKLGENVHCHIELARINGVDKAITVYIGVDPPPSARDVAGVVGSIYFQNNATHPRQNIARLVGKLHAEAGSLSSF